MQRLHIGAKGATMGGVTGPAQGLGKELAMESRAAGMADVGRAIPSTFAGRIDFDRDGHFEFDDVRKGIEKLRSLASKQARPWQCLETRLPSLRLRKYAVCST